MRRIGYGIRIGMACLAIIASILILAETDTSQAAKGSDFKPGRIIDDTVFYNEVAMSTSQIQSFLNSKVSSCDTNGTAKAIEWGRPDLTHAQYAALRGWHAPPYTCLKDYKQNTPQMEAASGLCGNIPAYSNRTAAQIINDVSKACLINPQVFLVLLQKEQSLVTDTWPLKTQYSKATGFGCPDTAPCDPNYAGFFYQVYHAGRQFNVYKKYPNNYNYITGRTNKIYWHPDLSRCGSSQVYIENQATAALYIYTPYRPNQAALDNMYGTGDSCSSYGNRNFWRLFTDWFESTLYTVRGAIKVKYDSLGGTNGLLGSPTMNERCGLVQNGCYQVFRNGSIYWTQATGAHLVRGGIRGLWAQMGYEKSVLGYPLSDEISVSNGVYQQFQNGRIYWQSETGALSVHGGIGARYHAMGAEVSVLGFPTGPEACGLQNSGCYQSFQNGSLYWSEPTGAKYIKGGIRDKWASLGYERGHLGYPTSDEICGLKNGGCYQSFQNGRIYWSSTTNAWPVWGAIGKKYIQTGSENGALGYPISGEVCGLLSEGCHQIFEGGSVYWTQKTGAHSIKGDIRDRWSVVGYEHSRLGYPTSDETCGLSGNGCYQIFQGGRIYWSNATSAQTLWGGIGVKYIQLGAEKSSLGYPIASEVCNLSGDSCYQDFRNGRITWSKNGGSVYTLSN